MKHHPSDLIYLFLNLGRPLRFFTNPHFFPEPVFFKSFSTPDLVLDALHCGIFYASKIINLINFIALVGNKKHWAFTYRAQMPPDTRHRRNIHDFGPFFWFLRNYSDVALPVCGSLLFSAPLEEHPFSRFVKRTAFPKRMKCFKSPPFYLKFIPSVLFEIWSFGWSALFQK